MLFTHFMQCIFFIYIERHMLYSNTLQDEGTEEVNIDNENQGKGFMKFEQKKDKRVKYNGAKNENYKTKIGKVIKKSVRHDL